MIFSKDIQLLKFTVKLSWKLLNLGFDVIHNIFVDLDETRSPLLEVENCFSSAIQIKFCECLSYKRNDYFLS